MRRQTNVLIIRKEETIILQLKLKQSEIKQIRPYLAQNGSTESLSSIKKRSGADIVINGGLYTMATGKPESWLVIDGKIVADKYSGYGYGINGNKISYSYQNNVNAPHFIGAARGLISNGEVKLIGNDTASRGRTALGLTALNELIVYCSLDSDIKNRMTTTQLAQKMKSLGCVNAIELDGGLSSQYANGNTMQSTARSVSWWICIWLEDNKTGSKIEPTLTAAQHPVLKLNSTGEFVDKLQGILKLPITGKVDNLTYQAILNFQGANNLEKDGSVGPLTWAALLNPKSIIPTIPTTQQPKKKIILDPGHSVLTAGKRSPDGLYVEHEFALDMAFRMEKFLVAHGVEVYFTRKTESPTVPATPSETRESRDLVERAKIANSIKDLDLLFSIHSNAASGTGWVPGAIGYEAYTSMAGDAAERNKAAKEIIAAVTAAGITMRKPALKHSLFYILRNVNAPAVLVEHGFHTNEAETTLLKSNEYRNKLAESNCRGILNYFKIPIKPEVFNSSQLNESVAPSEPTTPAHWAQAALDDLVSKGLIISKDQHTNLDVPISKGEVFTIISALLKL